MIWIHVYLMSGNVHAVPTRATATRGTLRSAPVTDSPTCSWWNTTPQVHEQGAPGLRHGPSRCPTGNAEEERASGINGDTLRAFANGRKDDWGQQLSAIATRPRP
jgi:hypothetical protein